RVNAQSRVLEEALVRRRVPYYVVGGVRFYDHREIRDLTAYLRVIANPADALSLERAIGVPPRGIGAKTIAVMSEVAGRDQVSMFQAMGRLETESRVALRTAKSASFMYSWMRDLMGRADTLTVREIIDEIVARSGFATYVENLVDGAGRRQNVA